MNWDKVGFVVQIILSAGLFIFSALLLAKTVIRHKRMKMEFAISQGEFVSFNIIRGYVFSGLMGLYLIMAFLFEMGGHREGVSFNFLVIVLLFKLFVINNMVYIGNTAIFANQRFIETKDILSIKYDYYSFGRHAEVCLTNGQKERFKTPDKLKRYLNEHFEKYVENPHY